MARRAAVLILVLILVFICCLLQGSTGISLAAAMEKGSVDHIILFSVRLPRVLACFFAGLAFAASGCLLQAATGNELASGNVIGINSGAGFAVLLVLSLAPGCFARPLGLSEAYFNDLLKFETGQTLTEYLQSKQIHLAKQLLLKGEATPAAISARLGFPSLQYFTFLFKKLTGTTPADYRRSHC